MMQTAPTLSRAEQFRAAVMLCEAFLEAIKTAGPNGIPEGTLYAMVMGQGVSLGTFERIVGILIEAGKVSKRGHVLTATA